MTERLEDWQTRLSERIEQFRNETFSWQRHNCLLWALQGIEAVYGIDKIKLYRDKATDARSAARVLQKVGKVKRPVDVIEAMFADELPIAFARKGDIVSAEADILGSDNFGFGPVLGVCYGAASFFVGEHGLTSVNTFKLGRCYHGLCSQSG